MKGARSMWAQSPKELEQVKFTSPAK